ncbi:MAG: hypothetical protein M9918_13380 [Anaerolineae bacterium]|nr:hypothetical protein [Anaerolineae bacterium]
MPPDELRFYWDTQRYGDPSGRGWLYWKAGLKDKATALAGVYEAFASYAATQDKVTWSERYPGMWRTVDSILTLRRKQKALNNGT